MSLKFERSGEPTLSVISVVLTLVQLAFRNLSAVCLRLVLGGAWVRARSEIVLVDDIDISVGAVAVQSKCLGVVLSKKYSEYYRTTPIAYQ